MWWMWLAVIFLFPTTIFAEHGEVNGTLEYVIVTDEHESHSKWLLLLDDGTRLELDSPSEMRGWTGKKVRIRGEKKNEHSLTVHELLEADGSPSLANDLPPEPAPDENIGFQRAAVIHVEFQNKPDTLTPAQVQSAVDSIVEPYYAEVSDGQTTLQADVYGKYTLPHDHHCTLSTLIAQAIAASDADVFWPNYNFITIVSPSSCGYGGIALLGRTNLTTADGVVRMGYSNNVTTSGATRMGQIVVHELGHNFRSHHSGFLRCPGFTLPPGFLGCTRVEYGNIFSGMGDSRGVGHFDAPEKAFVGFYLEGLDYRTITTPGRYTIAPHDTTASGLRGLRIQRGLSNNYLWIEARQDPRFLTLYPTSDFAQGALLTVPDTVVGGVWAAGKPLLLDASPVGTPSPQNAALLPGATFIDQATGLQITTVARTATALTVDVTPGTPDLTVPTAQFISPPEFTVVAGITPVTATASDNALANMEIYAAGKPTMKHICGSSPCTLQFDTTQFANGYQSVAVRASDGVGNTTPTKFLTLRIENGEPPPPPPPPPPVSPPTSCTITSPLNNSTVPRRSTIPVAMSSNGTRVRLTDNSASVCTDTTSPFSCSLFTGNGRKSHTLQAFCSNVGSAEIASPVVNIRNQ